MSGRALCSAARRVAARTGARRCRVWRRCMTRGLFFSLDGIDGCGKSTQCRLLADWLQSQGHTVTTCRDPGGTVLGDQLRAIVLEYRQAIALPAEALLFM